MKALWYKQVPYKIDGWFIPTTLHYTNLKFVMPLIESSLSFAGYHIIQYLYMHIGMTIIDGKLNLIDQGTFLLRIEVHHFFTLTMDKFT